MKFSFRLLRNREGVSTIELGLIITLISLAALTTIQGMGDQLKSSFNTASQAVDESH